MILGVNSATYILIHVIISMIGIGSGILILFGLLFSRPLNFLNKVFLFSMVLSCLSGFAFPSQPTASYVLGILPLILATTAICARYVFRLHGAWRRTYVITAMAALYFNFFFLVSQLFQKVPAFHSLAPTQSEAPYKIVQLLLLVSTVAFITLAAKRFGASREKATM